MTVDADKTKKAVDNVMKYAPWIYMLLMGLFPPKEVVKEEYAILNRTLYSIYTESLLSTRTLYGTSVELPIYEVTIDNSSNPNSLSDYQVLIKIDNDPQFFSDANNNRNAVRVYDEDKVTKLPYWIEEWDVDNYTAKIWVKVPSIPASSTKKIYIILNTSLSESEEDPESVFEFFDDFDGDTLDTSKWSIAYGNIVYELGDSLITFTNADPNWVYDNTGYGNQLKANFTLMDSMIIEMKAKMLDQGTYRSPQGTCGIGLHTANKKVEVFNPMWDAHAEVVDYYVGGGFAFIDGNRYGTKIVIEPETFYILQVVKSNNITLKCLRLDYGALFTFTSSTTAQLTYMSITVGRANGYPFTKFAVDWYRVRKYTEPEPTVSYVKL